MTYTFKGPEYTSKPLELELDTGRGVLYLHDTTTGITILRVCRIPRKSILRWMMIGSVSIDLSTIEEGAESAEGPIRKESPVFLEISKAGEYFIVVDEAGAIIFEVLNVPEHLLESLDRYEFTDITCGYTGKGI